MKNVMKIMMGEIPCAVEQGKELRKAFQQDVGNGRTVISSARLHKHQSTCENTFTREKETR